MRQKLTTKQFIQKAIKIHGNRYDYLKVNYKNSKTKIEIFCNRCKTFFWQTPNKHLNKQKCPNCSKNKKSTTQEFIEKAIKVHGDLYDYCRSLYIGSGILIEIICKIHTSFWQKPYHHLIGSGCPDCGGTKIKTTQEFIKNAIKIHGNSYNYSKIIYINNREKIEIICNKCKTTFWQIPSSHLQKHGCPTCYGSKKHTTQEFIEKASKIHNNKYSYLLIDYNNLKFKIKIICLDHKIFEQSPRSHLSGKGCPSCSHIISKPETQWLDSLNIPTEYRQFKIKINGKLYKVDGFDPTTRTIYEFLGDYYHGNPNNSRYKLNELNKTIKKTFGELYMETMNRLKLFRDNGYNMIYIWENDFKNK